MACSAVPWRREPTQMRVSAGVKVSLAAARPHIAGCQRAQRPRRTRAEDGAGRGGGGHAATPAAAVSCQRSQPRQPGDARHCIGGAIRSRCQARQRLSLIEAARSSTHMAQPHCPRSHVIPLPPTTFLGGRCPCGFVRTGRLGGGQADRPTAESRRECCGTQRRHRRVNAGSCPAHVASGDGDRWKPRAASGGEPDPDAVRHGTRDAVR